MSDGHKPTYNHSRHCPALLRPSCITEYTPIINLRHSCADPLKNLVAHHCHSESAHRPGSSSPLTGRDWRQSSSPDNTWLPMFFWMKYEHTGGCYCHQPYGHNESAFQMAVATQNLWPPSHHLGSCRGVLYLTPTTHLASFTTPWFSCTTSRPLKAKDLKWSPFICLSLQHAAISYLLVHKVSVNSTTFHIPRPETVLLN